MEMAGQRRLGHVNACSLVRAIGQERNHRRLRPGDLAGIADDVGDIVPVTGDRTSACRTANSRVFVGRLRLLDRWRWRRRSRRGGRAVRTTARLAASSAPWPWRVRARSAASYSAWRCCRCSSKLWRRSKYAAAPRRSGLGRLHRRLERCDLLRPLCPPADWRHWPWPGRARPRRLRSAISASRLQPRDQLAGLDARRPAARSRLTMRAHRSARQTTYSPST